MYVIVYALSDTGHTRLHMKHGMRPYESEEEAGAHLVEFNKEYEPHMSYVMQLREV